MGVDTSGIKDLRDAIENLRNTKDELMHQIAKELTRRLLSSTIKRTPVGGSIVVYKSTFDENNKHILYKSGKRKGQAKYKKTTTHTGGTLRRGWTAKDMSYFGTYRFDVLNNVFYCTYVENGHRQTPGRYVPAIGKRLKRAWAPGKHMLSLSVEELQKNADKIIEKKVNKWLNEVMK